MPISERGGDGSQVWVPVRFFRAVAGGEPVEENGYEWRGLILRHSGWATPRTNTKWSLIHKGSGATIARFTGTVLTVFPVVTEIAECADFALFDLPEGWRQTDPDVVRKFAAICAAHPEVLPDTSFEAPMISDEDARAVIAARENRSADE